MAATGLHFRLERGVVRFVAVAILAVSVALLGVTVATTTQGCTVFGPSLGADYAAFYTAGTILHDYPAHRLYDLELQDRLYHELFPWVSASQMLPYANPPFVAGLFEPLARLPYTASLLTWLGISAGFYGAGLYLILGALKNIPRPDRRLIALIALSFEPFVMECWLGGQLSAVGFFWIALALRFEQQGRPLASGLALGWCLYKPTLLPLLLPMLVFSRRWRTLLGFALTGVALLALSLLVAGPDGCRDYARLMLGYASAATGNTAVFRLWKFVDLNSFLKLLGVSAELSRSLVLGTLLLALPGLAAAWWKMDRRGNASPRLAWAATIACTLVLNVYVGVYDTVLLVLAMLLICDVYCQKGESLAALPSPLRLLLIVLYVAPWLSQLVARHSGVQIYTLCLMGAAAYPLVLGRSMSLYGADEEKSRPDPPAPPLPWPARAGRLGCRTRESLKQMTDQ